MISRVKEFFSHPWFISLVIWGIIIFFVRSPFSRYVVKTERVEYLYGYVTIHHIDLDSDGNSETINVDLADAKQTKVIFTRNNRILDEYDLPYQPHGEWVIYPADYNRDGYKECFIFTLSRDSIFLNVIDPLKSRSLLVRNRFIDIWKSGQNSEDKPNCRPVCMVPDITGKRMDFLFYINSGFSLQPRNVYRYMIDSDSLIKSPESGEVINGCQVCDITGDSLPEILLDVGATGNMDRSFPYSDSLAWLMVLDHNLNFLFPPVVFGKNPSNLKVRPVNYGKNTYLAAFYNYFGSDTLHSAFALFYNHGEKILEKPADDYGPSMANMFNNTSDERKKLYFLQCVKAVVVELDSAFREIHHLVIPAFQTGNPSAEIDADLDGRIERIFKSIDAKSYFILRDNFTYPTEFHSDNYTGDPEVFNFLRKGKPPLLYFRFKNMGVYVRYMKNPLFYLKYAFYAIFYLLIFLFIKLLDRIQLYRLSIKQRTEREMTSLQIRAIKNQIDPHFTLNVLNAIGSLYASEKDREKADYIFGKYAKLIRQTVISSDQILVTLGEELDFVKNYLGHKGQNPQDTGPYFY